MQILKANNFKSITISHLINNCPNSICVVYDDFYPPFSYNNVYLSSKEYSLEDLKCCVLNEIVNAVYRMDYIIVHTNKTEKELEEFISFIEKQSIYPFREILIACKP